MVEIDKQANLASCAVLLLPYAPSRSTLRQAEHRPRGVPGCSHLSTLWGPTPCIMHSMRVPEQLQDTAGGRLGAAPAPQVATTHHLLAQQDQGVQGCTNRHPAWRGPAPRRASPHEAEPCQVWSQDIAGTSPHLPPAWGESVINALTVLSQLDAGWGWCQGWPTAIHAGRHACNSAGLPVAALAAAGAAAAADTGAGAASASVNRQLAGLPTAHTASRQQPSWVFLQVGTSLVSW